jgi:hypothetical protein
VGERHWVCCRLPRNISRRSVLQLVNNVCAVDFSGGRFLCFWQRYWTECKDEAFVMKHAHNEDYIKANGGKGSGNNANVSLFFQKIMSLRSATLLVLGGCFGFHLRHLVLLNSITFWCSFLCDNSPYGSGEPSENSNPSVAANRLSRVQGTRTLKLLLISY